MISVAGIYSVSSEMLSDRSLETKVGGALSGLALGLFYVLSGSALPRFPSTSHSGPSAVVRLDRTLRPIYEGHIALFPIEVDWKLWDRVVVPVLEDSRWIFESPLNRARVNSGDISGFVYELEMSLWASLQDAGYIP